MGNTVKLTASDGHEFAAYEAKPSGTPRGGLVVIQEIFGVNSHIRDVTDRFAADGYLAIAPALFDRAERDVQLGYEPDDIAQARGIREKISVEDNLKDIDAARAAVEASGKVGIVGYCLGGSMAWLAATRLQGFSAAVGYYGSLVAANASEQPRCPVMLHFGDQDHSIPMSDVEKVKQSIDPARVKVFVYHAGHGFNCDQRGSYDKESATTALERTREFFAKNLG